MEVPGEIVQVKAPAGCRGIQQYESLVPVVGEFTLVAVGMPGRDDRLEKRLHPADLAVDDIGVVYPVDSQGQRIGGKGGQNRCLCHVLHLITPPIETIL